MSTTLLRVAAAFCFLAVALGVFGAYALKAKLEAMAMLEVWNKAVLYHLLHGVALAALALHGAANRAAFYLMAAGILLFSGSLYVMALIPQLRDWLGAITPLGGLCFLTAWAWLVISPKA